MAPGFATPTTNVTCRNGSGPSVALHAVTVRSPLVASAGTTTVARCSPITVAGRGAAPGRFTVTDPRNVPSSVTVSLLLAIAGEIAVSSQSVVPDPSPPAPSPPSMGSTSAGRGDPHDARNTTSQPC